MTYETRVFALVAASAQIDASGPPLLGECGNGLNQRGSARDSGGVNASSLRDRLAITGHYAIGHHNFLQRQSSR